jgi:hypothetical protein
MSDLGTEFQPFLYAPIGEEKNGTTLSVLSALARLGLDPWKQANDWSRLPQQAAVQKLAAVIAALPDGSTPRPPPEVIATRLVALLPALPQIAPPRGVTWHQTAREHLSDASTRRNLIVLIIITALAVQWLAGGNDAPARAEQAPRTPAARSP